MGLPHEAFYNQLLHIFAHFWTRQSSCQSTDCSVSESGSALPIAISCLLHYLKAGLIGGEPAILSPCLCAVINREAMCRRACAESPNGRAPSCRHNAVGIRCVGFIGEIKEGRAGNRLTCLRFPPIKRGWLATQDLGGGGRSGNGIGAIDDQLPTDWSDCFFGICCDAEVGFADKDLFRVWG